MTPSLMLPGPARRALTRLAHDVARVLGDRLVAVVATGPSASVVFARSITAGDLEALGSLAETWHRDGLDTPLLLTAEEFRRSLDAFPVEYLAMIDRHTVITGDPPFQDVQVAPADLRRACEVQAKGHLIHLRQGWIEAAGRDDDLSSLIARSAAPLRALLSNVARLHGAGESGDESALDGARLANLPDALVAGVLALEDAPEHAHALVRDLPAYLAASERLWAFVNDWRVPS